MEDLRLDPRSTQRGLVAGLSGRARTAQEAEFELSSVSKGEPRQFLPDRARGWVRAAERRQSWCEGTRAEAHEARGRDSDQRKGGVFAQRRPFLCSAGAESGAGDVTQAGGRRRDHPPNPGREDALPSRSHEVAPARRGSAAAASGPPQQPLGRLLRGNNAAPPRVARRGAGRRTPDTRERAAERARGALAESHGRGAVPGRGAARPGGAGGRGAGPGPPLVGTEGAGPGMRAPAAGSPSARRGAVSPSERARAGRRTAGGRGARRLPAPKM